LIEGSTCAVAVPRADAAPASPVYQDSVLAAVPAIRAVAVANGGPLTRCGGLAALLLKKLPAAATAEAAVSDVAASVVTAVVRPPSGWRRSRPAWRRS